VVEVYGFVGWVASTVGFGNLICVFSLLFGGCLLVCLFACLFVLFVCLFVGWFVCLLCDQFCADVAVLFVVVVVL